MCLDHECFVAKLWRLDTPTQMAIFVSPQLLVGEHPVHPGDSVGFCASPKVSRETGEDLSERTHAAVCHLGRTEAAQLLLL